MRRNVAVWAHCVNTKTTAHNRIGWARLCATGQEVRALRLGETARASSVACGGVGAGIDAAAVPDIAEGVGPASAAADDEGKEEEEAGGHGDSEFAASAHAAAMSGLWRVRASHVGAASPVTATPKRSV